MRERVLCAGCGKEPTTINTEAGYYTYCPCDYGNQFRYNFLALNALSSREQFRADRRAAFVQVDGEPFQRKKRYYKARKETKNAQKDE